MTAADARRITGGLSNPSKMPGKAFGLPAAGAACPVGAKLAEIPGNTCSECYAAKGMYRFETTRRAQALRFRLVQRALSNPAARAEWIDAMVTLVGRQSWFRWHDSGDVFSLDYLRLIVDVVNCTPGTRHWLPTRELFTVRAYQRTHGAFPANLTVRLSLPKVDASAVDAARVGASFGLPTSRVTTGAPSCVAPQQGNECRDCRACWDASVTDVSYRKH